MCTDNLSHVGTSANRKYKEAQSEKTKKKISPRKSVNASFLDRILI
jgi:hypothetical protein